MTVNLLLRTSSPAPRHARHRERLVVLTERTRFIFLFIYFYHFLYRSRAHVLKHVHVVRLCAAIMSIRLFSRVLWRCVAIIFFLPSFVLAGATDVRGQDDKIAG